MFYKVVSVVGGKLRPLIHHSIGMEYKLGEWVEPQFEGSSIICCSTLEAAKAWNEIYDSEIYEAEGILTKNPVFIYYGSGSSMVIEHYWTTYHKAMPRNEIGFAIKEPMYKDMAFLDKIKLLRKVS